VHTKGLGFVHHLFNNGTGYINIYMLQPTTYNVPIELVNLAQHNTLDIDFKVSINECTGDFFYDEWTIKKEFEGTIWHQLLNTLPVAHGEARLIRLAPAQAYRSHSDIDDRYHLNISGDRAYLVNLDTDTMHKLDDRSKWFNLDASYRHSAVNFGRVDRLQLVVRQLFARNTVKTAGTIDNINVTLTPGGPEEKYRYYFDDSASQWINRRIKEGVLNNFSHVGLECSFTIEAQYVTELTELVKDHFGVITK
jgi:hypothetical protein